MGRSTTSPRSPRARAAHLRDEEEFIDLAESSDRSCNLKPVSFIEPVGPRMSNPGYASATAGSSHLVDLLQAVEDRRSRGTPWWS